MGELGKSIWKNPMFDFFFSNEIHTKHKRLLNMQTKSIAICHGCENPIFNPKDGVIVHGNIYIADPNELPGLIGNAFPKAKSFTDQEVEAYAYCRICFLKAIGWPDFIGGNNKPLDAWKHEEPPVEKVEKKVEKK